MAGLINNGLPFLGSKHADVGFNTAGFATAFRIGALRRVFRGVYIDGCVSDSRDTRILALQLVMPRHAVLCGCSAAWMLGVDTFPPGRQFDFAPECVVPIGSARSRSAENACRRALIDGTDVMETGGILHTKPVRIATDLLRTLRRPYALAAADSLAHAGLITATEVQLHLAGLKGYRGVIQAKELAVLIEAEAESPGESWQRLRLVDAGFPKPKPQFVIADRHGRVVGRLDNAYVEAKIGLEYDGREFHTLDDDKVANAQRRMVLTDVFGWRMENSTRDEILGKDPAFEIKVGGWLGIKPQLPRNW